MSKQTSLLNFVSRDGFSNISSASKKRKRRITPDLVLQNLPQQSKAASTLKQQEKAEKDKKVMKKKRKRIVPTLISTETSKASHVSPCSSITSDKAPTTTNTAKKKKKRIQPTFVSSSIPPPLVPSSSNVLTIAISRDINYHEHHEFVNTPVTETKTFDNHTDLQLFLNEMVKFYYQKIIILLVYQNDQQWIRILISWKHHHFC